MTGNEKSCPAHLARAAGARGAVRGGRSSPGEGRGAGCLEDGAAGPPGVDAVLLRPDLPFTEHPDLGALETACRLLEGLRLDS